MSVPLTRRGWKIFETEADGMPHVSVSPALCLCASVPIFRAEDRRPGKPVEDSSAVVCPQSSVLAP
jgi:hypothetical protein